MMSKETFTRTELASGDVVTIYHKEAGIYETLYEPDPMVFWKASHNQEDAIKDHDDMIDEVNNQ